MLKIFFVLKFETNRVHETLKVNTGPAYFVFRHFGPLDTHSFKVIVSIKHNSFMIKCTLFISVFLVCASSSSVRSFITALLAFTVAASRLDDGRITLVYNYNYIYNCIYNYMYKIMFPHYCSLK